MRSDFETSGDIRDVDLLAAFVGIWKNATSGAISFSRSAASAGFGLAGGEIVSVSSSEARFESSAILVRAGKLDATALERLAIPEGTDGALAALQTGILTKREWRWGEKIRAIEVLADLLAWPDGKYYFDADARPVAAEFTLTVPRLLLELFLRSRDRNLIEHQLGRPDVPIVRAPDFDHQFSTFGLTADAESVVRLIDGRATADEIARTAPAEDFAVRKLLAALTTLGLVHAGTGSAAQAVSAETYSGAESEEENDELVLEAGADTPVEAEGGQPWESDVSEAETTRVPEPDPRSGSPWDFPVRESSTRRTGAFAFDPPGSTSSLEAFPLPASTRADQNEDEGAHSEVDGDEPDNADEIGRDSAPEPGSGPDPFSPLPEEHGGLPPGGGDRKRGAGFGTMLGGLVAFLVIAILAVLYFRSRPVSTVRAADGTPLPVAVASPAPTAFGAAVEREASPSPAATSAARPETTANRRPPTAVATTIRIAAARPTIAAVRPTASPAPIARPARAEAASEKGAPSDWTSRAARDRRRLESERATRYAIQLELACETPSLSQAWTHDRPAGSMWLLETRYGSRNCFRVLWGRYPSLEAAKRAKSGIPSFFTTGTNRPAVVSVR